MSLGSLTASAVDDVNFGALFTLTDSATAPNGAWSWYEDERAIIDLNDPANPLLLVSSVSDGGGAEEGDIDLLWRNLSSGVQGEFELNDRLQADDHNSAALHILPDGRYLASYSRHGNDDLTRWRVSTNPHDPSAWGPEEVLNNNTNNGTTYNNTYYLPGDDGGNGRLYNFTRNQNFDPNVQTWDTASEDWVYRGKLLTEGSNSVRPYLRYASDGQKIHFVATEQHPRNFANSIYHGYVQDGQLFDTDGALIDGNIFNASGASVTNLTQVFANGSQFNGTTMNRAWTISMEIDDTGNPVAVFTARANNSDQDHRFFYARHDGTDWVVNEMAKAGAFLYAGENDYTGLVSIDPDNADVVYMSSDIDPITGIATTSGKYEIYQGVTDDFGQSWQWSAVTENSTVDNLRPLVPAWDSGNTALIWMRGNYNTFQDWDSEVVGISFKTDTFKLWTGAAGGDWDVAQTASWENAGSPGVYNQGDQATFDDTASLTTINIVGAVAPTSTAFNNNTKAYSILGGGIGGSGSLRVSGGGTVSLSNAANTYTGETLISNGRLALVGGASLTSTPQITVAANGVFDVSAVNGGVYTLSGQALNIEGSVSGNIRAAAGSSVHINSANAMTGNLELNNATAEGLGTVGGSLHAQGGGVIQVGEAGFAPQFVPSSGQITYVDADIQSNVSLADGSPVQEGVHYSLIGSGTAQANNRWDVRSFGNNNDVISSNNNGAENAPAIRVTIDGLDPGEQFEVFAYTWGNTTWRLRADLVGPNDDGTADGQVDRGWNTGHSTGSTFFPMSYLTHNDSGSSLNPGPLSTATTSGDPRYENGGYFSNGVGVIETKEFNRSLYQADLGVATADENGEIVVYIDDLANVTSNDRTFFDGVGFRQTQASNVIAQVNTLTISGDATFDSGSLLRLDLYGPTALDRLVVGGTLHAGGTLEIDLVDGAPEPDLGDSFQVLSFVDASGGFDGFDLPELDAGLYWDTSSLLITGVLSVSDTPPGPAGDLSGDGDVDDEDLGLFFSAFTGPDLSQGPLTNANADLSGDGDVDDEDLGLAFGQFTGPLSPINVPDPSSLSALVFGGFFYLKRHGRRRPATPSLSRPIQH